MARQTADPKEPELVDGYLIYTIDIASDTTPDQLMGMLLDQYPQLAGKGLFWSSGAPPAITAGQRTVRVSFKVLPTPAELQQQKAELAALPQEIQEILMPGGVDSVASFEYQKYLQIAAKLATLSDEELADYKSKISGSSGSLSDVEKAVDAYVARSAARAVERDKHEAVKTKLYGLEAVYEQYKLWKAKDLKPSSGGHKHRPGPSAASIKETKARRATMEAVLATHGFDSIEAFETAIGAYRQAFENETVQIGLDLLAEYAHVLHEEKKKFEVKDNAIKLGAEVSASIEKSRSEEAAEKQRLETVRDQKGLTVESVASSTSVVREALPSLLLRKHPVNDPLVANEDFDRVALAQANTPEAVQKVMLDYIIARQADVAEMQDKLVKDHELIYKLPKLIAASCASQGILPGTIYDRIVADALHRAEQEKFLKDLLVIVVNVALLVATGGTAAVALAARIGLAAVDTYLAVETLDQYTTDRAAYHVKFMDDHPSFGWVIVAFMGAGFSVSGAAKAIGASDDLMAAVNRFHATGEIGKLKSAVDKVGGLTSKVKVNVVKQARATIHYNAALKSLTAGALNTDPLFAKSFMKTFRVVYFGARRGIASFEGYVLSLKKANLVGEAGLSAEQLNKLKAAFEEARAGAAEIKAHGKALGMAEEEIDDFVKHLEEGATIKSAVATMDEAAATQSAGTTTETVGTTTSGSALTGVSIPTTTSKHVSGFLTKYPKVSRSTTSIDALEELFRRTRSGGAGVTTKAGKFVPVHYPGSRHGAEDDRRDALEGGGRDHRGHPVFQRRAQRRSRDLQVRLHGRNAPGDQVSHRCQARIRPTRRGRYRYRDRDEDQAGREGQGRAERRKAEPAGSRHGRRARGGHAGHPLGQGRSECCRRRPGGDDWSLSPACECLVRARGRLLSSEWRPVAVRPDRQQLRAGPLRPRGATRARHGSRPREAVCAGFRWPRGPRW